MTNEALRLIRVFHDLKQVELANMLGISKSHLSEIESGTKSPSLTLIERYADVLDMPLSSIMFFAEELPRAKTGDKIRSRVANKAIHFLQFVEAKANVKSNN